MAMSTTISNEQHNNDDEIDDNISDEEEWLQKTKRIVAECPRIDYHDDYYRPSEFHDEYVCYGDGGRMLLKFPIWIRAGLSLTIVNSNIIEELLEVFYQLNDQRKDFHKHPSPVEDIIDPDLLVCKPIKPPSPPSRPLQSSHYIYSADQEESEDCSRWNYDPSTLRGSYQWIPSEFRICHNENNDCEVHIETPISHLPMTEEYEKTYRNIEIIFAKLVPMFGEILSFNKNDGGDTRLQVIMKVQSYNIQPGTKYSGRWHTEGFTENIRAVGVYYLHIDDELEGGALKFRPSKAPSQYYAEYGNFDINRYMMPETDTAIVFDNCLPHRFCSIRNTTFIARRRTFLNFFVVCLRHPINALSISDLPLISYEQCEALLKNIENDNNQQTLPDLVILKILSFLQKTMWQTDMDAKEFRTRSRNEMLNAKSGWAGIHYGNSGDILFIKSEYELSLKKQQNRYRDLYNQLEHTESD